MRFVWSVERGKPIRSMVVEHVTLSQPSLSLWCSWPASHSRRWNLLCCGGEAVDSGRVMRGRFLAGSCGEQPRSAQRGRRDGRPTGLSCVHRQKCINPNSNPH